MQEEDLFPSDVAKDLDVLIVTFDQQCHLYGYDVVSQLRAAGLRADLYPEPAKMKKQMKYANDRHVPHVVVIGSDEMESGMLTVKDMSAGSQMKQTVEELISNLENTPS